MAHTPEEEARREAFKDKYPDAPELSKANLRLETFSPNGEYAQFVPTGSGTYVVEYAQQDGITVKRIRDYGRLRFQLATAQIKVLPKAGQVKGISYGLQYSEGRQTTRLPNSLFVEVQDPKTGNVSKLASYDKGKEKPSVMRLVSGPDTMRDSISAVAYSYGPDWAIFDNQQSNKEPIARLTPGNCVVNGSNRFCIDGDGNTFIFKWETTEAETSPPINHLHARSWNQKKIDEIVRGSWRGLWPLVEKPLVI